MLKNRDDVLVEILQLCYSLDKKASLIYAYFAKRAKTPGLRNFWTRISHEEVAHVIFWKKLLRMAKKGMIPQIFDKPYELRDALQSTHLKIASFVKRSRTIDNPTEAFLLAYRIEFYMLHPEFETLFHFMKSIFHEDTPGDDYENHLRRFVRELNVHRVESPELEFLGETIIRFRELNRQLALQSHIDFLTGILNRRGLFNSMIPLAYLSQRKRYHVGIMMIDIDDFKKINDTYGHMKGDATLRFVAKTIKKSVRTSDITGRYGGEEFLVYLAPVEQHALSLIAEKIRKRVEKESKKALPVTISIGLAQGIITKNIRKELDTLIRKADDSLYAAKRSGKNRVLLSR